VRLRVLVGGHLLSDSFSFALCPRTPPPGGVDAGERASLRYDRGMTKAAHVFRYRIRNWPEYNRALINRGRLTVWFDEHMVGAWRNTEPATGPGAPRF